LALRRATRAIDNDSHSHLENVTQGVPFPF
jgi:hypothetical protein